MTEIIKNVSNLPEWFNLAKYAAAESMDSAGWLEQLAMRKQLTSLVGSPRWESWQPSPTSKIGQQSLQILALIRETPILNIAKNELLEGYFYDDSPLERIPSIGVHLTSVRNLYTTEGRIEKDKRDHARELFNDNNPYSYKGTNWIDEPVDGIADSGDFEVNIRVNMMLPDNLLVEHFKILLNELRGGSHPGVLLLKNTRQPNFDNWISCGVLPYMDLQIWQKEIGVKIPNRVMADAIFPVGEGGEEVVRKTTAKLADELLTTKYQHTLASLVALEIAERKTA